ncbi:AraC family transcriptional regulator [Desertibacillus haloalkaliphilus]|uniref:AraC family transcriptional regulator n=1 Tax=Desertibacillus haloalkaliphilus TaxID=1328930 RepID=UPI001C26238D|nr:AraC family transcriptional regulator [Desertibacillus haloalkaliphilus]MBU8908745.1 AraC family transcriptional regulator [Desertibacillus haloalkaliphilus]
MKESTFMPVINKNFEVFYWSKKYRSHYWSRQPDKSLENYSEIEPLFRTHSHDAMEILVFLGGECEFFCEGKTYSLTKGDVVIIPPYAVHQAKVTDFNTYERIVSTISKSLLAEFLSISPSMNESLIYHKTQGSYVVHLHAKNLKEILSLFQEISDRKKENGDHHSFALHYLLFQGLQMILHPASGEPTNHLRNEHDQRLNAIIDYIKTHLTDPDMNLDNVSSHFHLSKYYFSHYFKTHMKVPFYRYVLLKRLATAVTLIKKNELSIEEIAIQCGFQDYSSFYRLFKKEYNLSPKNLQKEFRGRRN